MAPTPSVADRVLVLEGQIVPMSEFRKGLIAAALASALAIFGAAFTAGALFQEVENTAQAVEQVRAEVRDLRQDLNARGQVGP